MIEPEINQQGVTPPAKSRHPMRVAAIGGIAAVAILGGGITAVASASSPVAVKAPTTTTSTVLPTSGAAGNVAPPTGGVAPTGTNAPKPPTEVVRKPHLDGTVTSVSGSTVLIKDRDGFTRTIVTSSKTTYNDGLKAALAVGTKIHAEGTVDANGTSLDATTIGADNGPMGGPGHGPGGPWGSGGPGGPGGPRDGGQRGDHGPGAPAPTGTKSAPTTTAPTTTAPTTS